MIDPTIKRKYMEIRDYLTEIQRTIGDKYFLEGKDVNTISIETGKTKNYITAILSKLDKKMKKYEEGKTAIRRTSSTFSLLDKTIAQQLKPLAEKLSVLNQIAYDVGWFTIWSMMQVGKLSFDDIVEFAESVNEDPMKLYAFVRNQIEALIHSAKNIEGFQKLVERVQELEALCKWLMIKCEFYKRQSKLYEEAYKSAVSLMNDEQRGELVKVIALKRMLGQIKGVEVVA